MTNESKKLYSERINEILKRFSRILAYIKIELVKQMDKENLHKLLRRFYTTYFEKIPEIPYIGGDNNNFSRIIAYSSPTIILWKVLKSNGWSIEDFALIYLYALKNFTQKEYLGIKGHLKRIMQKILIRKFFLYYIFKRQQKLSHKYPNNFIIKPLKARNYFDFGYAILQCPIVDFGRSQDAEEILPYICAYDWYRSYYTHSGLIRSKTLAEGDQYCDYLFKKGSLPKNLQATQIPDGLKPGQ